MKILKFKVITDYPLIAIINRVRCQQKVSTDVADDIDGYFCFSRNLTCEGIPIKDCFIMIKDEYWGWVVVFTTFTINLILDGVMYTLGIFYAEFIDYFKTTPGKASTVVSVFVGVSYCFGPVASGFVNKYGCRVVSSVGTIISCVGLLLSLAVPEVEYLYFTIGIITGAGFGLVYLPSVISIPMYLEKNVATAIGISLAGSGIGALIFAPLMAWLINYYGSWKGALLIATGLILNCLVLSLFYRDPIGNKGDSEENHSNNQNSNDSSRRYHLDSLNSEDAVQQGNKQNSFEIEKKSKETLPSKQNFCRTSGSISLNSEEETQKVDKQNVKVVNSSDIHTTAEVVTVMSTGENYRQIVTTKSRGTIGLTPVLLVELLGKDKLNNAYGIYMMITGIALSLGTPVSGVLFDETGSYNSGFYLSGGLTVLSALILLTIPIIQRKFPQ
ncbi:monocarboxylate transporter 12 [Caerostris darwini]|uniref:Monocarboxylate transporter 12 n=1 Tax=Caerostris darwini TaxID=1538125 RepID=A0AAV4SLH5_9ARAC|nr:monocarboxylate transporter 12 [Caerostris darwini]